MRNIHTQRHNLFTFVLSLVSILSMLSGCCGWDKPNTGNTTMPTGLEKSMITEHPKSEMYAEGAVARLNVVAPAGAGASLSYQSQTAPKGSSIFNNIDGTTSDSYTTPVFAYTDSGTQYRVVVTATNTANKTSTTSNTSNIATISVTSPVVDNRIVWTHLNGTRKYADVPADGILLSSVLTSNKGDIRSVDFIPSSVMSIGQKFFYNCSSLRIVRVEAINPPTAGSYMFEKMDPNLSITVPSASVGAYKAAKGWIEYKDKITGF